MSHPSMVTFRAICFTHGSFRLNGDSGDVHPAALKMDEKQHVVGRRPAQRQHFRREKVGPRQQRQVGPNEGRPCGRALALRRRRHTVASQNISHRLVGNLKPQIGQRPHNPVIAPGAVLLGHANNQFLNCPLDPGSAWASMLRAIEDGIRQSGSRYIAECLAAQSTNNLAELRSLGVRELWPTFNWPLRIWFSAARYSFRSSSSWSTVPPM